MEKFKDKIVEKDVGFAEDSFFAMKNAVGQEEHCMCDFVSTKKNEDFERYNNARNNRTELQKSIIKVMKTELKNQEWCRLKHVCSEAMSTQELIARCSSMNDLETAKILVEVYKLLYVEYLTLLGFNDKNISVKSSA
jgi:hypothetical protein